MNFTAFDFETANYQATSACSVGLAVVEDNKVVEQREFLIKPYPSYFNGVNISIHGITPAKVADAPTFDQLWPDLAPYLENRLLVAHNAAFDIGVMNSLFAHYGLTTDELWYYCSLKLARRTFSNLGLPGYGLAKLSAAFGISLNHHNAESDAVACAEIMIRVCQDFGARTPSDLMERFGRWGVLSAEIHQPFRIKPLPKKKKKA